MNILVLAPHTDDGELGCGGFIAKMSGLGHTLSYIAFSAPQNELRAELSEAADILGVHSWAVRSFNARNFDTERQDILDDMILLRKHYSPDMVLMPTQNDIHQDHKIIAEEAIRAFKDITILAYELPWNHLQFKSQAFSILQEEHIKKKIKALKCYKTQQHRDYLKPDFVKGLARTRGTQIGVKYAECFEVVRWLI